MGALKKFVSETSSALRKVLPRALGGGPTKAELAAREGTQVAVQVPRWYRPHLSVETKRHFATGKAVFLYMPWITEHTDALIARLGTSNDYELVPFDMFSGIEDNTTRRAIFRFAQENTDSYRRLVVRRLVQMRRHIRGIIFTFDWTPVTHVIASVCEELEIPKILIPHESVFVDRSKYYWDPTAKASIPMADVILGWGALQREIFLERGYPADRFKVVGAPKFDVYADYQPALTRAQFCRLYGLDPDRKLVLFATQPLDSQLDTRMARKSQRQAVEDLFTYLEARGAQLLVRLPPSKDDVLGPETRNLLTKSGLGAVDDAHCYLVTPEEALFHADVVSSVNSTMLFEAALLGRPALSMKYVEFDQLWEKVGIPAARNVAEMEPLLDRMLAGGWTYPESGMAWAAEMFGAGAFDGLASARIGRYLAQLAADEHMLVPRASAVERLFAGERLDVIGVPPLPELAEARQPHLLPLLNARTRVESVGGVAHLKPIASVDLFLRWGVAESPEVAAQAEAARALGRSTASLAAGLIGAPEGEEAPSLSIVLDERTAYYDARQPTRLERWLAAGPDLTAEARARARAVIDQMVRLRVAQDNVAPDRPLSVGTAGRRKVLVVDQPLSDPLVAAGGVDATAFPRMLQEVVATCGDCDILLKRPSSPAAGAPVSHLDAGQLAALGLADKVLVIEDDIHAYALLDQVDEVFVVTAQLGFEALLAGKRVHCFGLPFYAGWGLTEDCITLERRGRARDLEAVFHAAYIAHSRYFHPERRAVAEVEDLIDYIAARRG
ncbi:capsular polysaccharide export protein, LipB/KpsS family [Xanthobacter sp. ZOL 2024]